MRVVNWTPGGRHTSTETFWSSYRHCGCMNERYAVSFLEKQTFFQCLCVTVYGNLTPIESLGFCSLLMLETLCDNESFISLSGHMARIQGQDITFQVVQNCCTVEFHVSGQILFICSEKRQGEGDVGGIYLSLVD